MKRIRTSLFGVTAAVLGLSMASPEPAHSAGGRDIQEKAKPSAEAAPAAPAAPVVEEALAEDDYDPLAELVALADAVTADGPEAGGSIRAKKDADLARLTRLKDPRNIEVKVTSVQKARFPNVVVSAKVLRPAKKPGATKFKRNQKLVLVPMYKWNKKASALDDPATVTNAGAFYLTRGDRVMVRLGEDKGKYFVADYIERK